MFELFIDDKLSVWFSEDKAKCFLFNKDKDLPELNIAYDKNRTKQFYVVEHLGSYLDVNLSGESIYGNEIS